MKTLHQAPPSFTPSSVSSLSAGNSLTQVVDTVSSPGSSNHRSSSVGSGLSWSSSIDQLTQSLGSESRLLVDIWFSWYLLVNVGFRSYFLVNIGNYLRCSRGTGNNSSEEDLGSSNYDVVEPLLNLRRSRSAWWCWRGNSW